MAGEQVLASLREVAQRVAQAAVAAGRDPGEVALLLATKTVPAATILIALRAGYRLIGENRVQELVEKAAELDSVPHEAHFIGHLQKNKINQVVRHATCIQSLDSVELTEQVAARVQPDRAPLDVFVQVNTSGELSKYGCRPPDARAVVERVAASAALRLRGFMTIGLFSEDAAAVRDSYRRLREVRDSIAALGIAGPSTPTSSRWA